ncbi:14197_t:CDS:2 [Acaulospora morrowiae]|uniref:14197_t:CDS:1 n=1 Tax=Acaulospora morrowiae TaxID=94023 RepID=A0A9N9HXS8_9GLOM|nr:14197_t:CDS:2 [Acaulospora morrowiae]
MSRCVSSTIAKTRTLQFFGVTSFRVAPICLNPGHKLRQQIAFYASEASNEKVPLSQPHSKQTSDNKVNARISSIVDQIASLTLLETSELVQELKTRLNIQDVALPVTNVTVAAETAPIVAEEEKAPEKTEFTVKLEKYEASAKTKIIREIKNILPGMNLVEAKKFVESAPKVIKEHVGKDEAEKIKKTLEGFGATIIME